MSDGLLAYYTFDESDCSDEMGAYPAVPVGPVSFGAEYGVQGQGAYFVQDNSYCKAGKFIDATQAQTDGWDSTVKDNKEVPCKYQKEPPAFGHPRME